MTDPSLLDRIDRMESTLAVQQLPIRYAIAIDSRDIDGWLALFVDDVDCGRRGRGREALRTFIDPAIRSFYRSIHQIVGHAIDFIDADHATGKVYCKAEHEYGEKWIVQAICYFDSYERRDGRWYFARREEDFWYSADHLEHPQRAGFQHWPGPAPKYQPKMMLPRFLNWQDFWSRSPEDELRGATSKPV